MVRPVYRCDASRCAGGMARHDLRGQKAAAAIESSEELKAANQAKIEAEAVRDSAFNLVGNLSSQLDDATRAYNNATQEVADLKQSLANQSKELAKQATQIAELTATNEEFMTNAHSTDDVSELINKLVLVEAATTGASGIVYDVELSTNTPVERNVCTVYPLILVVIMSPPVARCGPKYRTITQPDPPPPPAPPVDIPP